MLKNNFEVCFKAQENGKEIYIAPQLLPERRPEFTWKPEKQSLRYIYRYPFMPKGLIGHLIVRLHEQISTEDKKKVLWVKGVKLTQSSKEGKIEAEALIQQTEEEGTGGDIIEITIVGAKVDDRKFLLKTIRNEFDRLHKDSFVNLKHFELVPCCCELCIGSTKPHFYLLNNLERRREQNIRTIECEKSFKAVPVSALLEGVFPEVKGMEEKESSVEELIGKGFLDEGVEKLFESIPQSLEIEGYALKGRWAELKQDLIKGGLSADDLDRKRDQIRIAALELCKKIREWEE